MPDAGAAPVELVLPVGSRMKADVEYVPGIRELVSGADGTASRARVSLIDCH